MPITSLANIKQGENERLKNYIHRFNMEATKVGSLTKAELKMAITAGVHPGSKLWGSMLKREVSNLDDFEREHRSTYVWKRAMTTRMLKKANLPPVALLPIHLKIPYRRGHCARGVANQV